MESSIPERSFVKKVCSRYLALSPFPLRVFPRLPSVQYNSLPTFCYLNTWTEARNRRLLNKLLSEVSLLPGIHSRSFTDGDLSSKFIFIWFIILSIYLFFLFYGSNAYSWLQHIALSRCDIVGCYYGRFWSCNHISALISHATNCEIKPCKGPGKRSFRKNPLPGT